MHCRMYCRSGHVLRRWKIVTEKSKVVRRGLFELCAAVAEAVCNVLVCWCAVCVLAYISRSRSYFDSGYENSANSTFHSNHTSTQ